MDWRGPLARIVLGGSDVGRWRLHRLVAGEVRQVVTVTATLAAATIHRWRLGLRHSAAVRPGCDGAKNVRCLSLARTMVTMGRTRTLGIQYNQVLTVAQVWDWLEATILAQYRHDDSDNADDVGGLWLQSRWYADDGGRTVLRVDVWFDPETAEDPAECLATDVALDILTATDDDHSQGMPRLQPRLRR